MNLRCFEEQPLVDLRKAQQAIHRKAPQVKSSKAEVHAKIHRIPTLCFTSERRLTSYSGLILFQALLQKLRLKERLRRCFAHLSVQPIFGHPTILSLLIVHLLLGFRRLRGLDYYRHDPLVARVVGLRHLPDVATVSRALASLDERSIEAVRSVSRELVTARLAEESFPRITVDFDGTVQSTTGHAEGTAVGYNKIKKGARSYYPLFATVAQTGQFFDLHHRAGNVHDSSGALSFLTRCLDHVRAAMPGAKLESRMDAAFFNEEMLGGVDRQGVDFTISTPFERFPALKQIVLKRRLWEVVDSEWSSFEIAWRPKSWTGQWRFVALRHRKNKPHKGPLQLDLFEPRDQEYEYKVIVTNKKESARAVLLFHNGRGAQEKIFGEAKQHVALDLVPTRTLHGNQLFTLAGMLAHNLTRELQMQATSRERRAAPKRPPQWDFAELGTIRQQLLHVAGELTHPQGELTLKVNDNPVVRTELLRLLEPLC
jgi:hypothetical protein